MRVPITNDEMRDAIQEVHVALPKYQLTPETMPQTVRIYRETLLPYDREAVQGGAKLGLRTWDKFPTPKAWRESTSEWIKRNRVNVEYRGKQDPSGRDICCRKCSSVAMPAWLRSPDGSEISRLIAPCDPVKHDMADLIVPYPDNFLAWDDRPIEPWSKTA